MKNKVMFGFMAFLLVAAAFLTACASSTNTSAPKESASNSTGASGSDTIKFGFISSLSGSLASSGELQKNGAEIAIKHINEQGGILGKKVELKVRDDKGKPEEAVKAARDLNSEGVNLFFGVLSSSAALALSPVMEEMNGVLINTASHSDRLTGKDFNKHYFRITDNAQMRNNAGAKLIAERYPDVIKWATFSPDYEYGHNTHDQFFSSLKQYNPKMELIQESWPPFGSPDFKNYISAVQNAKPEGVFSSLYAGDAIVMSKQAEPYHFYQGLKVFINPSAETDIREQLGKVMHEEWGGVHYYAPAYNNPLNVKFVKEYKEEYGHEPDGFAAEAYNAALAYKAAVEKTNSSKTDDVIKALEGIEYDSLTGKRSIRAEDHQAIKDVIWIHIVPSTEGSGWKVEEFVLTPGAEVIAPPSVK